MSPIAITGGVAEGKTTVLRHLASLGARVWSADEEAARLLANPRIKREVAEALGLPIDFARPDLAQRLREDVRARRTLNALLHAPILDAMKKAQPDVAEIPLLVEACLIGRFDQVWVVTCGPEEQRRRLVARFGDERAADDLLATQLRTRAKLPFADLVVRTNTALESVFCVIEDAWRHRNGRNAGEPEV